MGQRPFARSRVALRIMALGLAALAAGACGVRSPITNRVTLDFDKDDSRVTVTAVTEIAAEVPTPAMMRRAERVREALLAGHDEWSNRFDAVQAESERLLFVKKRGLLQKVEHSAVIDCDQLQQFFADVPMTIALTRGDGWTELAIYASSSTRATRQQRDYADKAMYAWCLEAARYLEAMNALYDYLAGRPDRGRPVFTILFSRDAQAVDKREQALIEPVSRLMDSIFARVREAEGETFGLDELTDLVYNPFPAEIVVRVPRTLVAVENFEKRSEDTVAIRPASLADAVASLEGRWLSPDPLAQAIRADQSDGEMQGAEWFAAQPRRSSALVTALDIQAALVEKLRPANEYKVRWAE
jgi:hypothetical protein